MCYDLTAYMDSGLFGLCLDFLHLYPAIPAPLVPLFTLEPMCLLNEALASALSVTLSECGLGKASWWTLQGRGLFSSPKIDRSHEICFFVSVCELPFCIHE